MMWEVFVGKVIVLDEVIKDYLCKGVIVCLKWDEGVFLLVKKF